MPEEKGEPFHGAGQHRCIERMYHQGRTVSFDYLAIGNYVIHVSVGVNHRDDFQTQVLDLTPRVREVVAGCGVSEGIVHLFVPGSTAGLTTIEFEPGCCHDLQEAFERVAPRQGHYDHNARWGDGNGHSHVRAALLGSSFTVPFVDGRLTLGTWQQIIYLDFDNRPRQRRLVAQVIGE